MQYAQHLSSSRCDSPVFRAAPPDRRNKLGSFFFLDGGLNVSRFAGHKKSHKSFIKVCRVRKAVEDCVGPRDIPLGRFEPSLLYACESLGLGALYTSLSQLCKDYRHILVSELSVIQRGLTLILDSVPRGVWPKALTTLHMGSVFSFSLAAVISGCTGFKV